MTSESGDTPQTLQCYIIDFVEVPVHEFGNGLSRRLYGLGRAQTPLS
jgi:hypothetical protein